MTYSSLVQYNPLSQDNPRERTNEIYCTNPHCVVDQLSVEKIADKTRKAGCSFAIGFDSNSLIVQRFPNGYMNG